MRWVVDRKMVCVECFAGFYVAFKDEVSGGFIMLDSNEMPVLKKLKYKNQSKSPKWVCYRKHIEK